LPVFSLKPGGKSKSEIPGKTIQVNFFENKSSLASSSASIQLTEGLRDIVLTQSKKELTAQNGDWLIEGEISDYRISPISIQAGTDVAAQNRLTMTVNFSWEYFKELGEDETNIEREGRKSVSAFVDYDSQVNFASVEGELLNELVRQLSQDIYDGIFGGKW
jgi:hypothetical protein